MKIESDLINSLHIKLHMSFEKRTPDVEISVF